MIEANRAAISCTSASLGGMRAASGAFRSAGTAGPGQLGGLPGPRPRQQVSQGALCARPPGAWSTRAWQALRFTRARPSVSGMRAYRALHSRLVSADVKLRELFPDLRAEAGHRASRKPLAGSPTREGERKLRELTGMWVAAVNVAWPLHMAQPMARRRLTRGIDLLLAKQCGTCAKEHGRSRKQAKLRPTHSPLTAFAVQSGAGRAGRVDAGRTQTLLTQSALATCWGSWRQRRLGVCRLVDAWCGRWHCALAPSCPCGASRPCGWCPQHGLRRVHLSLLTKARLPPAVHSLMHFRDSHTQFCASRDAEQADIDKEKAEQAKGPAAQAHELEELAQIYEERGLSPSLARQVKHATAQA